MLAAGHYLSPAVSVQNEIDLTIADRMINSCLISLSNLADLYQFTFFSPLLKRCQNCCFFRYAHIATIATIMVAGNCFQSIISVFRYKLRNIGGMKTCRFRYILCTCTFGS